MYLPLIFILDGFSFILASRLLLTIITFSSSLLYYLLSRELLNKKLSFIVALSFILLNFIKFPFLSPSAFGNIFSIISLFIIFKRKNVKLAILSFTFNNFISHIIYKTKYRDVLDFRYMDKSFHISFLSTQEFKKNDKTYFISKYKCLYTYLSSSGIYGIFFF